MSWLKSLCLEYFVTVHLTHVFLDLLYLTETLNWEQTSNSDPRTKTEASSWSIPSWQCIAVAWNGTARGTSRNEPSKTRKNSYYTGMARYTDCYTDVYDIIA